MTLRARPRTVKAERSGWLRNIIAFFVSDFGNA